MRMKTTKDKGNAADERFSSLFILDPFGGVKPPLLRVKKRRSGSTLSKPGPSGRGVEGLTLLVGRVS